MQQFGHQQSFIWLRWSRVQRLWHRNNRQRAFNNFSIECSPDHGQFRQCIWSFYDWVQQSWHQNNCQCIWWHRHQMQFWQLHQNNRQRASDRIAVGCSSSDITFIWSFFYVIGNRWSILYTFISSSFFKKRYQSSTFQSKIIFISYVTHVVSAKGLRNKNSQSISKHVFYVSANDHFNASTNGHFKRLFHARQTGQN